MAIARSLSFFVQWHLTERCNLSCGHCYQGRPAREEMTFSEIRETIVEIEDMLNSWSDICNLPFSRSFNITGGEPFLRQDLFPVLEQLRGHGFDEVYLLTNGTLINRERAQALSELGVKGVQVSFEGPLEIHERIRGKGSFARSVKGVELIRNEGIPVTANMTLSGINADHFEGMIDLASTLGVERLGFSRLVPSGRGADLLDAMLPGPRVKELYESIFSHEIEGLEVVTGDPVASQISAPLDESGTEDIPKGGCAAGVSGLTILPDGTITPCRRLNIPIGNVRKDALREVWAESEVLQQLRTKSAYKGRCGKCPRWSECRGCRAIAYAYALSQGRGDFLAEDPQCFVYR